MLYGIESMHWQTFPDSSASKSSLFFESFLFCAFAALARISTASARKKFFIIWLFGIQI
jgi:hypothetical protein